MMNLNARKFIESFVNVTYKRTDGHAITLLFVVQSLRHDMSSDLTQLHYAEVLRSHNLAAKAKLVFYFGLVTNNVCGDILIRHIQLRVFYINEH